MTGRQPTFNDLSRSGKLYRLRKAGEHALPRYGVTSARLRCQAFLQSASFRVRIVESREKSSVAPGDILLLKVYPDGSRSPEHARLEMTWLEVLSRHFRGSVPDPVPNVDGETVVWVEGWGVARPMCTLTRWIEGRSCLRRAPGPRTCALVGRFAAQLHETGREVDVPTEQRVGHPEWERLETAPEPFLPRVAHEILGNEGSAVCEEAVVEAKSTLSRLRNRAEAFGLIHGDLHHGNYLKQRNGIGVIDFSDCGYAPFICELATTVTALISTSHPGPRIASTLAGYNTIRGLHAEERDALRYLVKARSVMGIETVFRMKDHPYLLGGHGARYLELAMRRIRAAEEHL